MILFAGAAATSLLFAADAFFAFAGWRVMNGEPTFARSCVRTLYGCMERREPFVAAVAIVATLVLAVHAGVGHPRVVCLLGSALVALATHLLLHVKTGCLVKGFTAAPVGSVEWQSRGAKLEAAMVTRASLQAAAFICIVAAGVLT